MACCFPGNIKYLCLRNKIVFLVTQNTSVKVILHQFGVKKKFPLKIPFGIR